MCQEISYIKNSISNENLSQEEMYNEDDRKGGKERGYML